MTDTIKSCLLCDPDLAEQKFKRIKVWEDENWRLTISLFAEIPGFGYLEPKRHISAITELNGDEALTLGRVLAKTTKTLKNVTKAKLVYIYLFGDRIPHLHFHLAPHHEGDPLNMQIIKGSLKTIELDGGLDASVSDQYPVIPEEELRRVAEDIRKQLAFF